ncbi:MAG: CRISPR pre-crRNA endoribonuclease Cas5d [Gammaproteobacteria bacterium]|nr:CRISPR pre-crRNA endoribonuclease Cas5d [Gammaproteobacteria bacterium]
MANGTHTLEVWGDLACFTRPEMKVERFSYPVITPSAARGIFDAIYWDGKREKAGIRPYFYWQVTRIEVLEKPRYIALRRNEVKEKAPAERTIKYWMEGREPPEPIRADGGKDELGTDQKGRTQRQTMALKNVRYRLSARIVPNPGNEWGKLNACFQRRARAGKCFQQPYFGCREFPAFFEYIENPDAAHAATAPFDQHLGLILYDVFDLRKEQVRDNDEPFITLFDATVRNGVLEVPPFDSEAIKKPRRK